MKNKYKLIQSYSLTQLESLIEEYIQDKNITFISPITSTINNKHTTWYVSIVTTDYNINAKYPVNNKENELSIREEDGKVVVEMIDTFGGCDDHNDESDELIKYVRDRFDKIRKKDNTKPCGCLIKCECNVY